MKKIIIKKKRIKNNIEEKKNIERKTKTENL